MKYNPHDLTTQYKEIYVKTADRILVSRVYPGELPDEVARRAGGLQCDELGNMLTATENSGATPLASENPFIAPKRQTFSKEEVERQQEEYRRQWFDAQAKQRARREEVLDLRHRDEWFEYHRPVTIEEIDSMTGIKFEHLVARLLGFANYRDIELTPINDQGTDIICISPNGDRTAVQTKRYSGSVGNSAVQEVLGGMVFHSCRRGIVVCSTKFTESAQELAQCDDRIELWDRDMLLARMKQFWPKEIPDFSEEAYSKLNDLEI
jgi:hypothetical protein